MWDNWDTGPNCTEIMSSDSDDKPESGVDNGESPKLSQPLPGDPRRQAVASVHGTVYQAWNSIDAWLQLESKPGEIIYLEGAEDFDIVQEGSAIAVQVKRNTGTISLGTSKAKEALKNFWYLANKATDREVHFHYLTTSSVATEQGNPFNGEKGIEVWRRAQTDIDLTKEIADYLIDNLDSNSPLRIFLSTSTPENIQDKFIRRFHWLTNQPDTKAVKRSVDDRITTILEKQHRPLSLIPNIKKYLESRYWEVIVDPNSESRCLTKVDLLSQIEAATTTYMPFPIEKLPDLVASASPGLDLFKLLLDKLPTPPEPLLRRPLLIQSISKIIEERKSAIITGTVYKGKTTLAQLAANLLCANAWWISLSGRQREQVDNLVLVLAKQIENQECPNLVVLDDMDFSPASMHVYQDSLTLLLHRANSVGKSLLITAQGGSFSPEVNSQIVGTEIVEVTEIDGNELAALCIEHGCPNDLAALWSVIIGARSGGHPKLVQVQLAELKQNDWPKPSASEFTDKSSGLISAQHLARKLLNDGASPPVAEFAYLVSECSTPIHRSTAISIAERVDGISNGGDVVDSLSGKWLERIGSEWYRITALLKGTASQVWSKDRLKQAHILIHDSILKRGTLGPTEAAALVYHAFLADDPYRMATNAMRLQTIEDENAKREVERHLLWLPLIALEPGQKISEDAIANATLRSYQFQVAKTLDSEHLGNISARWAEAIELITDPEARVAFQAMMWFAVGLSENTKVPLKPRLDAIISVSSITGRMDALVSQITENFFSAEGPMSDIPEDGTLIQAIFLVSTRVVQSLQDLTDLLNWLETIATEDIRKQFDMVLEWPLTQAMGAFVQTAWSSGHEETTDWNPWLSFLGRIEKYAKDKKSPNFGREAAKAKAIILTEYCSNAEEAIRTLEQAEELFGVSPVILEQKANVYFHSEDDETVLKIWDQIPTDTSRSVISDPFAYRRVGISASRLGRWHEAGEIFKKGAECIDDSMLESTKFGLMVDAANALASGSDIIGAVNILLDAANSLPSTAKAEGDTKWEWALRAAVNVCDSIEKSVFGGRPQEVHIVPGKASSPNPIIEKPTPGQNARYEITKAQIYFLASMIPGTKYQDINNGLSELLSSKVALARWGAHSAQLAMNYASEAKPNFIQSLIDFDIAIADLTFRVNSGNSVFEPDEGPSPTLQTAPEKWFGLLVAGMICSGINLLENLQIWLEDSIKLAGEESGLTNQIKLLIEGAKSPPESYEAIVFDSDITLEIRCGAAASALLGKLAANKTFSYQSLLVFAITIGDSSAHQKVCNLYVARKMAENWRVLSQSRFQFVSPARTVPPLIDTINEVGLAHATLKKLMNSASVAVGQPLGEFMNRVQ